MIRHERFTPWTEAGPYRIDDYRRYDGDERCELLSGRFLVVPAPSNRHQTVVGLLHETFQVAARANGGRVLAGPADVVLSDETVVQPDLYYVAEERVSIVGPQETHGAPDIVVEVLSPGSRRRDRIEKLDEYARGGVSEYWIVDPEDQVFQFLELIDGDYRVVVVEGDEYRSKYCSALALDVPAFWADFARMAPRG